MTTNYYPPLSDDWWNEQFKLEAQEEHEAIDRQEMIAFIFGLALYGVIYYAYILASPLD